MPTPTPNITRRPTPASPSQRRYVISSIPHIANQHIVNILHLIDNILGRVGIEDGVQVTMRAKLLPHCDPGLPFRRVEDAGTFPEVAAFVERDGKEEGRVGNAD